MKHPLIILFLFVVFFLSSALANPQQNSTHSGKEEPNKAEEPKRDYGVGAPIKVRIILPSTKPVQDNNSKQLIPYGQQKQLQEIARELLDERQAVVRVYSNRRQDPTAFELVTVPLNGLLLSFDTVKAAMRNISKSAVIVLTAEDQKDELIATVIGDYIYAEFFKEKSSFCIWPNNFFKDLRHQWWTIKDAIGNPLPNAKVQLFSQPNYINKEPRIRIGEVFSDESGRLKKPILMGDIKYFSLIVSHPDYGIAMVERFMSDNLIVPLVREGTEHDQRSLWGSVVDPNGKPLKGASVWCKWVRPPGEGSIISSHGGKDYIVLTNEEGAFYLYMPDIKGSEKRGKFIPPKSTYCIRVEAPQELGFLPYEGEILNYDKVTIVMERGDHFRTFVFEDANRPITDPDKLKNINVTIDRVGKSRLTLGYKDWKNGGVFPEGTYRANMGTGSRQYDFEPVKVNKDSPEKLVFKFPKDILYYGQVVHGITGEPMSGAFVVGMRSGSRGNLSMITEEQWQTLHALPTDPCIYDPAIAPLRNIYGLTKITRTDEQGRFQMSFRPGGELYGFVAFEENYLGLLHRKHALKPDENRYAQVPPMKLFPAATVLIEPLVEEKHVSIWPRWLIDENNNPTWVSEFLATDDRRESLFTYDRLLDPNEVHSIYVPAGLNLCIKLDTPYDRKWCPIHIPQIINLTQGEVLDLGRYIFEPAIKVSVKVTNSMGELVEGVPVRMLLDSKVWSLAHNTDETGIARFYVAPHSKGEFGVTYHGKDKVHLKESIPFQIGGEQDEGREFVLQLSDELLYQLFK